MFMQDKEIKIVFITDSHLVFDEKFLGIDTFQSFEATIEDVVVNHSDADFYIFGGDLIQDQNEVSFRFFKDISSRLQKPMLFARGNHDINDDFFNEISANQKTQTSFKSWELISLNSYSEGNIYGEIKDDEIRFLQDISKKNANKHILVYMHHNLFPTKSPWIDIHITKNYQDLSVKFSAIENLKLVISGHIHQEMKVLLNETTFVSTPSTSFQFLPDKETFTLDKKNPAYTVLNLYPDGSFDLSYKRTKGHFGEPEKNPKLY